MTGLKQRYTNRGFGFVEFTDRNRRECSLQKSSVAFEDCVWFGCNEIALKRFTPGSGWQDVELEQDHPSGVIHTANTRMHLSREQVASLLPYLRHFVETGELPEAGDAPSSPLSQPTNSPTDQPQE